MFTRLQRFAGLGHESAFLWGARQTGKSTLLQARFPKAPRYDLLLSEEFFRLSREPGRFREEVLLHKDKKIPILIDEIQKVPALLNEVQWLMVNHRYQFLMSGSSARKLNRNGGNLLGGRALRYELFPLTAQEIPRFDLVRALNHGLLPRHYLAADPRRLLNAYVADYLKEEIAAEALTRNIPAFARFLEASAFSNGEMVNYENVASECGVSKPTAKEYFQILVDTLVARFVPSFQKRPKRRVILAPRFYYFDVGIANHLLNRGVIAAKSEAFGKAFEHFIFQELMAHSHYSGSDYSVAYWRTASQLEVDFILGDHEVAIEVKGRDWIGTQHLRGLQAFSGEYKVKKAIVVCLESRARISNGIHILPWSIFLEQLWGGDILR